MKALRLSLVLLSYFFGLSLVAQAATVQFQNGTATFSQTAYQNNSVDKAIDRIFDSEGWGIYDDSVSNTTTSQTAVWETTNNVSGNRLIFKMYFNHSNPGHLLGRFRLSTTKDNRGTFADGLDTGGNINANWTILTNPIVTGPKGMTFTTLPDNSILAGGTIPATGTYTITYNTQISEVTGIRLEALEDPSLPTNGPGLFPSNNWNSAGNFILTEIKLDVSTVEPSTGGSVTNIGLTGVTCRNVTTNQSVTIRGLKGGNLWDCSNAGLLTRQGDIVTQTLTGVIKQ